MNNQGTFSTSSFGTFWELPFTYKLDEYEMETPVYGEVDLEDYLRSGLIKEGESER